MSDAVSTFENERESLSRELEAGLMRYPEFVRLREDVNRRERAEVRRLAAALKWKEGAS